MLQFKWYIFVNYFFIAIPRHLGFQARARGHGTNNVAKSVGTGLYKRQN